LANVDTSLQNLGFSTLGRAKRNVGGVAAHVAGTDVQGQGLLANNVSFAHCNAVASVSGVTLPATVALQDGRDCTVFNPVTSTAVINVYPAVGENFFGMADNAPIAVRPGWHLSVWQRAQSAGEWVYLLQPAVGFDNPVLARARMTTVPYGGSYARVGNTLTVTATAHGLQPGMQCVLYMFSGAGTPGYYTVLTVPDANTFTVFDPASGATSGTLNIDARVWFNQGISLLVKIGLGGHWEGTLAVAAPDANYAVLGTCSGRVNHAVSALSPDYSFTYTTTKFRFLIGLTGGAGAVGGQEDRDIVNVLIVK
jgi:hypothetical protein